MVKLISSSEFNKMPIDKIIELLKTHHKINLRSNTSELIVRDLGQNKLHGIIFINNNEEMKDNKITKKPIKINKSFVKCPGCLQKTLIEQPFPESTGLKGSKYCTNCGYLEKPKTTKPKPTKTKDVKH